MKTALRTISVIILLLVTFTAGAASLSLMNASMVSLSAMNPVSSNSFSSVRGRLGEAMTDSDYIGRLVATGWKNITPRTTPQGLDHIALKFDSKGVLTDVLVVETKYTSKSVAEALGDTLDGKQMSSSWVYERVRKDIVSLYEDYIVSDSTVSIVDSVPENAIKKVYIDNDSCYFTDADGNKCFYSSSGEMNTDSSKRVQRAKTTSDNLLRYAESTEIRRRIVRFEQDESGNLHRFLYEITDGEINASRTIRYKQVNETLVPEKNVSYVLRTMDYKEAVADLYNIADTSVLDNLSDAQLLRLNRGLDAETADIIFSSRINSRQLALKLGLNENTNFRQLGLTDVQMKKVTAAISIDDIDDVDAVRKLKQRSNTATARQMGLHAGFAFGLGSVINIFQQAGAYGWDNVNYLEAGRAGLLTAGVSIAKDTAEGIAVGLIKKSVGFGRLVKAAPFAVDAIFDLGYVAVRYFNGGYNYTSQAIAEGAVNIAFDVAGGILTYALTPVIALKTAAIFAGFGSFASPIGTCAGFVLGLGIGAAVSFGSQYLVQPISSALEINGLWQDLDRNLFENVASWTGEHLSR